MLVRALRVLRWLSRGGGGVACDLKQQLSMDVVITLIMIVTVLVVVYPVFTEYMREDAASYYLQVRLLNSS